MHYLLIMSAAKEAGLPLAEEMFRLLQTEKALLYYDDAVKMCFRCENYQTMMIAGLGIAAEKICCLDKLRNQAAVKYEYRELQSKAQAILKQNLNAAVKGYVKQLEEMLCSARSKSGEIDTEQLQKMADKIPY